MMITLQHLIQPRKSDIFIWAVAFLLLQACIRLFLSPSLQADEAEIVLSIQEFRLGYDDHPPLYAWLYTGLSSLFGISTFSLALLKYSLLCFGVYQVYRLVSDLGNEALAGFAMLSYLFFWQIMPLMQIDYTHSVLLFAMTAWYMRQFFRFLETPSPGSLFLLALIAGLGLLAKPNFAVILIASLAAAVWDAEYRKSFLPYRGLLLLLVAGLVASPYFAWLVREKAQAVDSGFISTTGGFSILAGLESLSLLSGAIVANFLLFTVLGLLALRRSHPERSFLSSLRMGNSPRAQARLLWRTLGLGLLLLGLVVFLSNSSQVKERYLIPFDVLLPIAFVLHFQNALTTQGFKLMRRAGLVMALLLILFNLNEIIKPYISDKADSLNLPYDGLKQRIINNGFSDGGNILLIKQLYGGNLKRVFPDSRVISQRKNFVTPDKSKSTMLIWVADRYGKEQWNKPEIPPGLKTFAARYVDLSDAESRMVRYAEAPYFYYPERRFKTAMLVLPARLNR